MLIKGTGIEPAVAFNLAVPLFFALTVGGAYTIVYNLAEGTRRSLGRLGSRLSPVLAGVAGAVFVTVLGNLDGAVQVGQGVRRALFRNMPFGEFDFWSSTRMMPPGNEITEFPFFTFLFADLHAHLMAIPFTLLALGLALAVVLGATRVRAGYGWGPGELLRLAALGVAVGALRLINAWDFPTYMVVAVAAVFLGEFFRSGGLNLTMLLAAGAKSTLVFAVGVLVFLPFHLSYEAFYTGLEPTTNQTVLWRFLGITGLFVFIVGSFFVSESRDWLLRWLSAVWRKVLEVSRVSPDGGYAPIPAEGRRQISILRVSVIALAATTLGYLVSVTVAGWTGSTVPFLLLMSALVAVVGVRSLASPRADSPLLAFVSVMVAVALALAIGVDIFRVEGDVDRMNTVFKFYLQVWVLLALASAYLLWRLAHNRRWPTPLPGALRKTWVVALVALIVSASAYPVLGTEVRLRNRFEALPPTLDGMAYMRSAQYQDREGLIQLSSDYEAIRWLQREIEGSPIILEGVTPIYRWGGRVSIYTGLPTVVGWQWHQEQQRVDYRWAIGERVRDVNRIYNTPNADEALSLMRKYGVEYVYLGQLESLYYPGDGIKKFEGELSEHLEQVYQNEHVRIFRLRPG
jgi:YYY domain-containing protein